VSGGPSAPDRAAAALAHDRAGPRGAPAVVLLHGIGGGRRIWRGSVDRLAGAGFDVVAVDLPGYGGSTGLAPGGIDTMAAAVLALLDTLALPRAAVVGHSMGGMVAQELAVLAPDRVDALVLACTSPAFGRPGGDWQATFVAERLAPLDGGRGMAGLAAELVPAMVSAHAVDGASAVAQSVMAAVPEATYRRVLAAIVSFDRRASLGTIDVPTLCLAGAEDRTAPPSMMQRMAAGIPGAVFAVIDGAGHIANVEQPAVFDAALIDFLQPRARSRAAVPT
jgi:pimeloyl-ACP methyl ester carboxylesterase